MIPEQISLLTYLENAEHFNKCPEENRLLHAQLGLYNEYGELIGEFKKAIRDDNAIITPERREKIFLELGDVMWYFSSFLHNKGIRLSFAANHFEMGIERAAQGYPDPISLNSILTTIAVGETLIGNIISLAPSPGYFRSFGANLSWYLLYLGEEDLISAWKTVFASNLRKLSARYPEVKLNVN